MCQLEHKIAKIEETIKKADGEGLVILQLRRQWLVLRRHERLCVSVSQALTAIVTAIYQQLITLGKTSPESLAHWAECGVLLGYAPDVTVSCHEGAAIGLGPWQG